MAIICVVGDSLRSDPTLFGRAVTALGRIPLRARVAGRLPA